MNDRQEDLDALVAAADPHPQGQVDDLAVDHAGRDLMETIMTTTDHPRRTRLDTDSPRRRFVTPLLAAAAVTTIVAGGLTLRGLADDGVEHEAAPASSAPGSVDPGLPPTGANLHQVVGADGWTVSNLDDSAYGGNLSWDIGDGGTVELNWYPAKQYQTYLADRREIGPAQEVELLGQTGEAFTYPEQSGEVPSVEFTKLPETNSELEEEPAPDGAAPEAKWSADPNDAIVEGERTMVILPPVGKSFLELDVMAEDQAAVDDALAQLRRVSKAEWIAALGEDVVSPDEAEEFLAEVSRGVPMPDGVEVTVADLDLPQSAYHARIAFLAPVLCGWAEDYVGGDDDAIDVLRGSKDWAAVKALVPEGDYASVLADEVRRLGKKRDLPGFRQALC